MNTINIVTQKIVIKIRIVCFLILANFFGMSQFTFAKVLPFLGNDQLTAFNVIAGSPPISINFDLIPSGTDVSNSIINGVKLSSESGNSLMVVDASTTSSFCCGDQYKLFATSGANVLSPGGAELVGGPDIREEDGLQIDFSTPVSAFGVDLLFQHLDGASFTGVTVYGLNHVTPLYSNTSLSIPFVDSGDSSFLGFFSNSPTTNISRIVFNESDSNSVNPDSNIGYDTIRFVTPPPIPEPSTYVMLLVGLVSLFVARRKKAAYTTNEP